MTSEIGNYPFYPPRTPHPPPTPPLNSQKKLKFQKNKQKYVKTWSFHTSVPKIMIICYTVPETWHMTNKIAIFYFGLFSTPLPSNSPQNQNFILTKKLPQYIIILHMYQKLWLDDVGFLRYGTRQMDGHMTDRKSDVIEVGAPPKNYWNYQLICVI